MAIKFFNLTKPLNIFLFVYIATGFFIISSLVFFFTYFAPNFGWNVDFAVVFIMSRVAVLAMLATLAWILWRVHTMMKADTRRT